MPKPDRLVESRSLSTQGVYTCPVCRHGEITTLTLMDAFACNFCHHIFTANLAEQSVQVVDSSQALVWRWNGQSWRSAYQRSADLTGLVWVGGAVLTVVPPLLIGLPAYMFPPLEVSSLNIPLIFTGLAFFAHLTIAVWLVAEHHQFPLYMTLRVRLGNLLGYR